MGEEQYPRVQDDSNVDRQEILLRKLRRDSNNKLDMRYKITHTFTTTNNETFNHNLGKKPNGYIITSKSKAADISGDKSTWTAKQITLKSSVANVTVDMMFH